MITLFLLVRATYMYGVILHAHPVRGESHIYRNNTGEVAILVKSQLPIQTTNNFYIFLTSTSAPHFEKGSATIDSMHSSNPLTSDPFGFCAEPSPESLHQGSFTFVWGGFTFVPKGA